MDIVQKITQTVEGPLDAMGYVIVLIKMADGARRKTLTIMAERADDVPMGFDDCTDISRAIGALLEVEDPIVGAYDLEVCSPGLDRPLTRLKDYAKYAGLEAKVETFVPLEGGRKRFRGVLKGLKGETVQMEVEGNAVEMGFGNIRSAKLASGPAKTLSPKPKPGKKKHSN